MDKQMYQSPDVDLIEVRIESGILSASVGASRGDGYGDAIKQEWD